MFQRLEIIGENNPFSFWIYETYFYAITPNLVNRQYTIFYEFRFHLCLKEKSKIFVSEGKKKSIGKI